MEKEEELVVASLTQFGFAVTPILPAENRTADLLADDGTHRYLIEVKTKESSTENLRRRDEALQAGLIHKTNQPLKRLNRYSSIVHSAANQLRATLPDESLLRLVWLQAVGLDHHIQCELFESSLYGKEFVTSFFDKDGLYPCFHFYESDFFRDRDVLDGAVICEAIGAEFSARLCLNMYSERYEQVQSSKLGRHFGSGVCDPRELEKLGRAYWADCDIDRDDKEAVLAYLSQKYDRPNLTDFQLGALGGEVRYVVQ
jgi:hypothetical protein